MTRLNQSTISTKANQDNQDSFSITWTIITLFSIPAPSLAMVSLGPVLRRAEQDIITSQHIIITLIIFITNTSNHGNMGGSVEIVEKKQIADWFSLYNKILSHICESPHIYDTLWVIPCCVTHTIISVTSLHSPSKTGFFLHYYFLVGRSGKSVHQHSLPANPLYTYTYSLSSLIHSLVLIFDRRLHKIHLNAIFRYSRYCSFLEFKWMETNT